MKRTAPTNLICRLEWVLAAAATLAAVGFHCFFLRHAGGLWRDEVNLVNLAGRHDLGEMAKDSFPVLMPLAVGGWTSAGFGQTDFSLRVLGVLIGLGVPAGLWLASLASRRPPLFSLTLFGLNAAVITYGDSLRAYGLGSWLIVLAAAAAWHFLRQPSWPRAGLLALASVLSVQALYQNAVLVAAVAVGAWAICARRNDWRAAGKILLAGLLAAASLLPYWNIVAGLPAAAVSERTGFEPGLALGNFSVLVGFPKPACVLVWAALACAVPGFGGAAFFARGKRSAAVTETTPEDLALFAGATLLAALAGFTGFLWFAAVPTQPWYFLPLAALMAVCLDFGLPLPSLTRLGRTAFFTLAAAITLLAVAVAPGALNQRFTNVDTLARRLAAEAAPQDFVVVTPWYCGIGFARYFQSATPWQTLPPLADHATHRYDLFREAMKTPDTLRPVWEQMAAALQSGHRIWVVGRMDLPRPGARRPADLPPPPLPGFGWSDFPYSLNWMDQTAWYLANHSRRFEGVDAGPGGNVNPNEDLRLFMAQGWKDATNANE